MSLKLCQVVGRMSCFNILQRELIAASLRSIPSRLLYHLLWHVNQFHIFTFYVCNQTSSRLYVPKPSPPRPNPPPPAGVQRRHDLRDISHCGGRLPHERDRGALGSQRQRRSARVHSHSALLGAGRRLGAVVDQQAEATGSNPSFGDVLRV